MNTDTGKVYQGEDVTKALARGEPLVELPHAPNQACRKCRGRGTLKSYLTPYQYGACPRCYPDHAMKAVTFAQRLRRL